MILRIGNKGFTLIEVMAAAAILASGVVLVYEALFNCLDAFNYYSDYLGIVSWADEKIWQAQDSLGNSGALSMENSGEYVNKNRTFLWAISYGSLDQKADLFKIDLNVSWRHGKKQLKLSRTAYALYAKK